MSDSLNKKQSIMADKELTGSIEIGFVGVVDLLLIEGCEQLFESQCNNVWLVLGFSKKNWITGKIHSSILHLVKCHRILQQAPVEKLLLVWSRGSTTKNVQSVSKG